MYAKKLKKLTAIGAIALLPMLFGTTCNVDLPGVGRLLEYGYYGDGYDSYYVEYYEEDYYDDYYYDDYYYDDYDYGYGFFDAVFGWF